MTRVRLQTFRLGYQMGVSAGTTFSQGALAIRGFDPHKAKRFQFFGLHRQSASSCPGRTRCLKR
jgi:hypothetical protein